jgi:hypothetical protein
MKNTMVSLNIKEKYTVTSYQILLKNSVDHPFMFDHHDGHSSSL